MRRLLALLLILIPVFHIHAQPAEAISACGNSMLITPGFNEREPDLNGDTRNLLFYVPESYDNTQPVPLILSLHGFASSTQLQVDYSHWHELAEEHGFLVAYPEGTGIPIRWNAGELAISLGGDSADDVAYLSALMDWFVDNWCIDEARIYVNGLSNGGGMTERVACELADRVAAVGMVSGAYNPLNAECNPSRPIPVIAFHGTSDFVVPYDGQTPFNFPDIDAWAVAWADRNDCGTTPERIAVSEDVRQTLYSGCADDATVSLYTIEGGGHIWYGWDVPFDIANVRAIDSTRVMWAFFDGFTLMDDQ